MAIKGKRRSTETAAPAEEAIAGEDLEEKLAKQGKSELVEIDYRSKKPLPDWVREAIESSLAIEAEDAKSAGALGFMARAMVQATMPYKDPKRDVYMRRNGDFKLRVVAGYEGGIPFGIYPRLLLSWLTTEAVKKQSAEIELGASLAEFLREVVDVRSRSGGSRGTATRVSEQMKRLFGSLLTATYEDTTPGAKNTRFRLRNVMIADELDFNPTAADSLWEPQASVEAGKWKSSVHLTQRFYEEITERPVPIDLRAYKALRGSALAMDLYNWLTYRNSYLRETSRPIPWVRLMAQFGSSYGALDLASDSFNEKRLSASEREALFQARRNFRKSFVKAIKMVNVVYPQAKVDMSDEGVILIPSKTSIQGSLF